MLLNKCEDNERVQKHKLFSKSFKIKGVMCSLGVGLCKCDGPGSTKCKFWFVVGCPTSWIQDDRHFQFRLQLG